MARREVRLKPKVSGAIPIGPVAVSHFPLLALTFDTVKLNSRNDLTQEMVKDHLYYCPKTGVFLRIKVGRRAPQLFGKPAGGIGKDGYLMILILGHIYPAHRLAWLYIYGQFPTHFIDHINRDRQDNRLANLREATRSENAMNAGMWSHNSSGVKGVSWSKHAQRWEAHIKRDGVKIHLGLFDEVHDAALVVRREREKLHGEFASHG